MTIETLEKAITIEEEINRLSTLIEKIEDNQYLILTFSPICDEKESRFKIEDQGIIAQISTAIGYALKELEEEFNKL